MVFSHQGLSLKLALYVIVWLNLAIHQIHYMYNLDKMIIAIIKQASTAFVRLQWFSYGCGASLGAANTR